MLSHEAEHARRRRDAAAARYKPEAVELLLVAEAPPAALDRYFYFKDVPDQDSLFRHVARAVLAIEPSRSQKPVQLQRLADRGVFLIDLKPDPKLAGETLEAYVPDLVARAVELRPRHVITLDPNVYHGHGADELKRFLAGAQARGELALLITTMGNVNDHSPRPLTATADATVSLPGLETYISGAQVPAGATISLADGIDATDRDLALRLRNERASDGPWWSLALGGSESWPGSGGPPTRYEPSGELQPILIDGLGQPVLAAFTPPDGSQRWYIVPDVCDWHSILDWLVQRALPQHVPGALRRSRSPLALDPQLQTPAEIAARRALEELKATFAEQQRDLENQLEQATANAEPIRNGLLYGTGTDLENAVAAVLEAAGLNVVKVDELLGDTTSADLVVTLAGKRRLIEVKSASGSAAETLVRQLETHLQTWPQFRPNDCTLSGYRVSLGAGKSSTMSFPHSGQGNSSWVPVTSNCGSTDSVRYRRRVSRSHFSIGSESCGSFASSSGSSCSTTTAQCVSRGPSARGGRSSSSI